MQHRLPAWPKLPKMEAASTAAGFAPAPVNPQPFSAGPQLQPHFDGIELLPPAAAERLRALRQRAADAHALVPEFETIREASAAKVEAANALARLVNHPQDHGFGLKPDDPRVVAAEKHLEKMTADFELLTKLQEARTAAWHAASAPVATCEDLVRHGLPGGCTLQDHEGEPPELKKGEDDLSAVERLRRRGRELRADLHRIRSAPFPSSHAKQRMRAEIEALAQRGAPVVTNLIEHDGPIIWPTLRVQVDVFNAQPGAVAWVEIPDTVGMNMWRHKSEWIAALDDEISTESDDKAALSHEARQQREAEVQGDLLAIGRDEAALTWSAMEQGLPVEFRADISPLAILQVRLVTTARTTELPETSPGLSWLRL
ncbi:hypothetical protein [Bradyrhizobium sp. 6(2017)]|uniref:hypothetical protein n=1 Tax=Bradyrhizobium sp. 6(2017) TaxID=1197460 RepID=UPI002FE6812D